MAVCLTMSAASACRQVEAVAPVTWPVADVTLPLASSVTDRRPAAHDAGADYFPKKAVVRHAGAFTVTYHGHYKVVEIAPHIGIIGAPVALALAGCAMAP